MANEKNLKPFEKGQSGNPAGRPKGSRNMKTILKENLESNYTFQDCSDLFPKYYEFTGRESVMHALFKHATAGNMRAMRMLLKRIDKMEKEEEEKIKAETQSD